MANEITGAETVAYLDGTLIGTFISFSVDAQFQTEPLKVMGQLEPIDHKIVDYDVTFQFRAFRRVNDGAVKQGLMPGMQDSVQALGTPGKLLEIRHLKTGVVLERLKGARFVSSSRSYEHGQTSFYDGSGVAIKVVEEGEV